MAISTKTQIFFFVLFYSFIYMKWNEKKAKRDKWISEREREKNCSNRFLFLNFKYTSNVLQKTKQTNTYWLSIVYIEFHDKTELFVINVHPWDWCSCNCRSNLVISVRRRLAVSDNSLFFSWISLTRFCNSAIRVNLRVRHFCAA